MTLLMCHLNARELHGDTYTMLVFANVQHNTNALLSLKHAKMDLSLIQSENAPASLRVKLMISLPLPKLSERTAFLERQMTMRIMSAMMTAQQDFRTTLNTVDVSLMIHQVSALSAQLSNKKDAPKEFFIQ